LIAASLLWAGPARATVTWKADFETGNLSQFSGGTMGARDIEFVTDPVQQGKIAGKFTVHANDTFGGSQMRVLINHSGARTGEGQDVFMSFYFLIATDPLIRDNIAYWESNGSFRNMMTWWLAPKAGGGTTLNFGTGNLGSTKHILTTDIAVGRWHQLAFNVHWSTSAQTGNIIVWVDGEKVVDEKAQTKPDGNALFFQAGIHRAGQSPLVDTVFLDNFIEGDSLADIMVMPGGSDGGADQDAAPGADAVGDAGSGGASGSDANGSGGSIGIGGAPGSAGATGGDPGGPTRLIAPSSCAISPGGSPGTDGLLALALLIGTTISVRRRRPC
jgi:hypothetical protein